MVKSFDRSYCAAHREDLARIAAGDPAAYAGFDDPLDPQQNYIQRVRDRSNNGQIRVQ